MGSSSAFVLVADETAVLEENAAERRQPLPFQPTIVLGLPRTRVDPAPAPVVGLADVVVVVVVVVVGVVVGVDIVVGEYIVVEEDMPSQVPFDVLVVVGASEEKEDERENDDDDHDVPKEE